MFARLDSHPPLKYSTVVPFDDPEVTFRVLVESESLTSESAIEIWHNFHDSSHWEGLALKPAKPQTCWTVSPTSAKRVWWTAALSGKPEGCRPVSFTIRFRLSSEGNWKWAKDQINASDGRLLYQKQEGILHRPLSDYFDRFNVDLQVSKEHSDTPDAALWCVTTPAAAAQDDRSGLSDHFFGVPSAMERWFAVTRIRPPWFGPNQGSGLPLAGKDTVLYSFLRSDGLHVVMLAFGDVNDVLTVLRYYEGRIVIHSRNDHEESQPAKTVIAVGRTFETATAAAMYYARRLVLGDSDCDRQTNREMRGNSPNAHSDWVQDWEDGFTYCTWNGLGQDLTAEKIKGALNSLKEADIQITNLIIDDGWQSRDMEPTENHDRGWLEFEADKKAFPAGLRDSVAAIRRENPDINYIGVWHALLGYWNGIAPGGRVARAYKTRQVRKRNDFVGGPPGDMFVVDEPDVRKFFEDFYSFLRSCGVDSVKADAQFYLDELDGASARRSLTRTYYNSWNQAQLANFGGHAISCMSQTPPLMFRCHLASNVPAIPVRNSDDYFPDVEDSHAWHIFCNAHNAVVTAYLNVLPDWDMFQTAHPWAGFHAAARCISGGPISITDEPGEHNADLVRQITAQTPRGQTVVLRPSSIGRSIDAYADFGEDRLCKVGAYNGAARHGSSFLAVFNCRPHELTEIIPLGALPGTTAVDTGADSYVVRSFRTRRTQVCSAATAIAVDVGAREWDILAATPVEATALDEGVTVQTSNLGLVDKMTGAAAVLGSAAEAGPSGRHVRLTTSLKALGLWAFWTSAGDGAIDLRDDLLVLLEGAPVPFHCVGAGGGGVVQVDLQRAWRELGLRAGWANQVEATAVVRVGGRPAGGGRRA